MEINLYGYCEKKNLQERREHSALLKRKDYHYPIEKPLIDIYREICCETQRKFFESTIH